MKIINVNQNLPFAKGWTVNKLLKGGGVAVDPSEISGWEVLADLTLDENEDYVDFVNLDINTDKVYRLYLALRNASGTHGSFYLYVNGIYTDSFYDTQRFYAADTTVTATRVNDPGFTYINIGHTPISIIDIIKDVDGRFRAFVRNSRGGYDASYVGVRSIICSSVIENLTSVRIEGNVSGALGEGSRLLLTKLRTG